MALVEHMAAVRESVAISRLDHVAYARIRGDAAFAALDRIVPNALRIRDGQMLHTLLLEDDGKVLADAYLCSDDEEFFLLAEGLAPEALVAFLSDRLPPGGSVQVEDASAGHAIVALDGPYAWELLGRVVTPEAIGLPYLTFYHHADWICYRAGRTGEYGYGLIAPRDDENALLERLRTEGPSFDAREIDLEALDQASLENWFFNIRREGREPVTPIELQLQWRVSYHKDYPGAGALQRRRREGAAVRLTCLIADSALTLGQPVRLGDAVVGRLVNTGYSHARSQWIGLALMEVRCAHPGIDAFRIGDDGESVSARSVSPPVLVNRSLTVSPQLHSYSTRHEHVPPPLVRSY